MANQIIRPDDLPPRANPVASEVVPSDNGSIVAGVTWTDGVNAGRPLASQNEAEAGVQATKAMTPLTTKQAIDAQVPVIVGGAIAGLGLGTAAQADVGDFATAAQGGLADTAVQPGDLATVATSGSYLDLTDKPTLSDETSAESRAWAIANLHPVSAPSFIRTAGYSAPGDLGGALYKYVVSEPGHAGKFSITLDDGVTVVWYEIVTNGVANVKAFGAKGDYNFGTGTGTDDTTAVTNTIGYLQHLTGTDFDGGTLFFPKGAYSVSEIDLTGAINIEVRGEGQQTTWIVGNAASGGDFVFGCDGYPSGAATRRISLKGISITAKTSGAYQDCVRVHNAIEWVFDGFSIGGQGFTRAALKMEYAYVHNFKNGAITNSYDAAGSNYGVLIGSGTGGDNNNLIEFDTIRFAGLNPDRPTPGGTSICLGITGLSINMLNCDISFADIGVEQHITNALALFGCYFEYTRKAITRKDTAGICVSTVVNGCYIELVDSSVGITTSVGTRSAIGYSIDGVFFKQVGTSTTAFSFGTETYNLTVGGHNGYVANTERVGTLTPGGGTSWMTFSSSIHVRPNGLIWMPGMASGVSGVEKIMEIGPSGAAIYIGGIASPEGVLSGIVGSEFSSTTGGGKWYKESGGGGNTGWVKMN